MHCKHWTTKDTANIGSGGSGKALSRFRGKGIIVRIEE